MARATELRRVLRWAPLAVALAATAVLWGVVDRWWPLLPLGYGPRWPWLALPLIPLLGGGLLRHRMVFAAVTLLTVLWGLLGFRVGLPGGAPEPGAGLRIVSFNAAVREDALRETLAQAVTWSADLVVVVECPTRAASAVPGYRSASSGRLCVWSRGSAEPVITNAPRDPAVIGWSGTIARVSFPSAELEPIGVVHLRSVRHELEEFLDLSELLGEADSMEARRSKRIAGSRYASAWMRDAGGNPGLVVGDFNLVVESPRFRGDWSAWRDTFEEIGVGTGHTWHSRWYGLRIDHVLHDTRWRPVSIEIGPPVGSDHRALLVELARRQ